MRLVWCDDRGRLYGRWNLIDASIVLLVLLMFPVALGAWRFFQQPVPQIISVSPSTVAHGQSTLVHLQGHGLRPYLRARVGDVAVSLFVASPSAAELTLPATLPIGTYPLTLSDEAQPLSRRDGAITVVAPPKPEPLQGVRFLVEREERLQVAGSVVGLIVVRDAVTGLCGQYIRTLADGLVYAGPMACTP